jgi:hypothetical protein
MTTVTLLTPIVPTLSGTAPEALTFTAAAANQWAPIANEMMTLVFIKNTDNNVSHSLTLTHYKDGDTNEVIAVTGATAGAIKVSGVLLPYRWANRTAATTALGLGSCQLTWSSTTGMSIAVVHVPYASK